MKYISSLFLIVILSVTMAYAADVNDNTGTNGKSGTGTFGASVIQPLAVETTAEGGFLGEFVKSATPYSNMDFFIENASIMFNITGEPGHTFYYTITEDLDGTIPGIASITIDWFAGQVSEDFAGADLITVNSGAKVLSTLGTDGYTIEGMVTSVTAPTNSTGGSAEFVQTLTVSYNF